MSKRVRAKLKARLLKEATAEAKLAAVSLRPLRLAFLLRTDASGDTVLRCIRHSTSVWGGVLSALIPTDGQTLGEDWWQVLRNHDPDMIVCCGSVSGRLRGQIGDLVQPFNVASWPEDDMDSQSSSLVRSGSLPMARVLRHIYDVNRPIEQSRIRLAKGPEHAPLGYCAAAQFGVTDDDLTEIYTEAFRAEVTDLGGGDFSAYMAGLSAFGDHLSPLDLTRWGISTSAEEGATPAGLSLVLLGAERWIEDLCVFWNLRMCPHVVYKEVIGLPIDLLRSRSNLRVLARWCNENVQRANYINLVSATVSRRRLLGLRDRLKPLLCGRIQLVHIWHDRFGIEKFRAFESEYPREATVQDGEFKLAVPRLSLSDVTRSGDQWVLDVDFADRLGSRLGYVPPRFGGLNRLLFGQPSNLGFPAPDNSPARVAHSRLSYRVANRTQYLHAYLPTAEELFVSLLERKGYRSSTTDKCRYITGISNLLGGYPEADILRDGGVLQLLECMCRSGAHTADQMKQVLKPGQSATDVSELAQDLARDGVFLRGYTIQCPACDLTQWYPVLALSETMACAGCLSTIQPPPEAPFSYKLNELMVRGIQQGAIPVLLTILALSTLARRSFLHTPGIEVRRGGIRTDIDLLASCDGELLMAECKDLRQGCSRESAREIGGTLEELAQIAERVGARVIFLSSLTDAVPRALARCVYRVARSHAHLAIHIISGPHLTRGYLCAAEVDTPSLGPPETHVTAQLRDFLPKPRASGGSGWLRESGQSRSYGPMLDSGWGRFQQTGDNRTGR